MPQLSLLCFQHMLTAGVQSVLTVYLCVQFDFVGPQRPMQAIRIIVNIEKKYQKRFWIL